ncbi:MAG: Holliday junction branch migration DNA helicase RuvB [Planctomycetota bacterium]|jgi:Holliday junction DNA helicase RuvB|nr:Holliday junction branch migration DNA helicase RuvB [Planctomycetota bacterium]
MADQPPAFQPSDDPADRALRPKRLQEFTGQKPVVRNLAVAIEAARGRDDQLDHVLLSGPPGLGKTTLAHIIAAEMGAEVIETAGPMLDKPGDLAGILSSLRAGSVLFIDEIHSLKRVVEEYLYSAMEDFRITVQLGEGATANTLTLNLQPFTLVAATTREGQLSPPLRSRFAIRERLDLYGVDDLTRILSRSATLLGVEADGDGLIEIARRSRGTARYANNHLRRIRDLAQVRYANQIDAKVAHEGLGMLGIDAGGLTELDRRMLKCLADHGRPVGLKTLAVTVGEEESTLEDVYEPFLIQSGFLYKTPQGRRLSAAGYRHIGMDPVVDDGPADDGQQALF